MNDWRIEHRKAIDGFLEYINNKTDKFILKGGTALLTCYNLDRFSEDIDLDGKSKNIENHVKKFCDSKGYSYRIAKDTDTVKRYMVNYGNDSKPLKIEISFRKRVIDDSEIDKINGIMVYNINTLCLMKTNAYIGRDKIRDLYDVSFICNNYLDKLSPIVISNLRNALDYKGLEHFDYIVNQQKDELIQNSKLVDDFLQMYEKLDLLQNDSEKDIQISLKKDNNINTNIKTSKDEKPSFNDILKEKTEISKRFNSNTNNNHDNGR